MSNRYIVYHDLHNIIHKLYLNKAGEKRPKVIYNECYFITHNRFNIAYQYLVVRVFMRLIIFFRKVVRLHLFSKTR